MSTFEDEKTAVVNSIFSSLLEECIYPVAVRSRREARLRQLKDEITPAPVAKPETFDIQCTVCKSQIRVAKFSSHLPKCLSGKGSGAKRSTAIKADAKSARSDSPMRSDSEADLKGGVSGKKAAANLKRRGRPPNQKPSKAKPVPSLSAAQSDAILTSAITSATQRLQQQASGSASPTSAPGLLRGQSSPQQPHPLSQSIVASNSGSGSLKAASSSPRPLLTSAALANVASTHAPKSKPAPKKRARSRHSSQASSSSESEEEAPRPPPQRIRLDNGNGEGQAARSSGAAIVRRMSMAESDEEYQGSQAASSSESEAD